MLQVARRGMEAATSYPGGMTPEYYAQLQEDAQAYENAGPEMEINPATMLPVILTAAVILALLSLIKYSLNNVAATLAMIESPTSITIVETKLPAYSDEPLIDERILKSESDEPLPSAFAADATDADVEVTLVHAKPITRKIRSTMAHLRREGGFTAQLRGIPIYLLYLFLHHVAIRFIAVFLPYHQYSQATASVLASVLLRRLHMAWIHSIVSAQKEHKGLAAIKERLFATKRAGGGKALFLPTLVYAIASQAVWAVPSILADSMAIREPEMAMFIDAQGRFCEMKAVHYAMTLSILPISALVVGLGLVLPAAIALTRIEAALLPENESTIVPFDRAAFLGEIDLTLRGGSTALFVRAWRSAVDRSTFLRVVRFYFKIVALQSFVAVMGGIMIAGEVLALGGERIALVVKSGSAQLQLAAIEAANKQNQGVSLSSIH